MVVLLPKNEDEMVDIFCNRNLFDGIPVVLILPSEDKFVRAMGYRLRPRFMC